MNLFIAKLNPATTSQDLQKLFAHYGFVTSVKVIKDHFTGKSKNYGFVEMPNEEEASEALKELDATTFQDSVILVKNSQPTQNRSRVTANQYNSNRTITVWNQHQYTRDTSSNPRFQSGQNSNRNYGYRGSGPARRDLNQF